MTMLATKQAWIPVTARTPEPGSRVLVFCRNDEPDAKDRTWKGTTAYDPTPDGSVPWPYLTPRWASRVTHWMPLPDDPTG